MKWYTAYLHETDELVACGPAPEVAKALGLTLESLYCSVSRSRYGKQQKYDYVIERIDEHKFEREYAK